MTRFPPDDCFTAEEEAAQDAREAQRQEHEWLCAWGDDFHSDEWAATVEAEAQIEAA